MKSCFLTIRSVTPAHRAEAALRRAGVDCILQRTPRFMQEQGCGYSLLIRQQDAMKSAELLRSGQIPFRKIYLRREGGAFEEVVL